MYYRPDAVPITASPFILITHRKRDMLFYTKMSGRITVFIRARPRK